MADLTITAASVALGGASARTSIQVAGETLTQGQAVYLKLTDGKYWKADADAVDTALCAGIVLTPAAADGYFVLLRSGLIKIGATVTVGLEYYCSTVAGGICPIGDLASGDFATRLGFATTAAIIDVDIDASTVAKA